MLAAPPAPTTAPTTPAGKIDPKLIAPFITSVRSVFSTMVGVEIEIDRPRLKATPAAAYDVSAIMQLGGDLVGVVVLSFEEQTARALVEAFAGMPLEDEDFADAVGELGNMVAGAAKGALNCNASLGIPSVILGHGHQVARLKDVPCIEVPCSAPSGRFAVEVCLKNNA
jgi:CheY-specific phosphatase CheX